MSAPTGSSSVGVELFGTLELPLGGASGYIGVRGKQGKRRDMFQGYVIIDKKKVTAPGLFGNAHDAAVARAALKQQLELGLDEDAAAPAKPRAKRGSLVKTQRCRDECAAPPISSAMAFPWSMSPAQRLHAPVATPVTVAAVPLARPMAEACSGQLPVVVARLTEELEPTCE